MPLHPESQQLIQQVEELSGRMVHVTEDPDLKVMASPAEQEVGMEAMGLGDLPPDFARSMVDQIVIQLRTYSVGFRIDQWIREHCPGLREQQEHAIGSQLSENAQALAPEAQWLKSRNGKPVHFLEGVSLRPGKEHFAWHRASVFQQ